MAIKGLTERKAAFPRIGKLRKGGVKPAKGPGRDLDHFRFDSTDPAAVAAFTAVYGETPKAVNVRLPYPTVEENFQSAMERYGAGGLEIRCDKEFKQGQRVNGKFMQCFPGKSPCEFDDSKKDNGCGCKPVGRLNVIIPELQRFAYVTAETHSINDLVNLTQQLTAIEMTFGQLNGVPLVLTRRPEQVSTPSADGGRARREKWMLSIEVSPEWASRQIEARDTAALAAASIPQLPGSPLQLPPAPSNFEPGPRPDPLPTYDFTQSDLWLKIKNAFHTVQDAAAIALYEKKALTYIESGELPQNARTMVVQLVERAYQKLSDRAMPVSPCPAQKSAAVAVPVSVASAPSIDLDWEKGQLWLDLVREAQVAPKDDLESYERQVDAYIQAEVLPPATGPAMQKIVLRRMTDFSTTVDAEVVS